MSSLSDRLPGEIRQTALALGFEDPIEYLQWLHETYSSLIGHTNGHAAQDLRLSSGLRRVNMPYSTRGTAYVGDSLNLLHDVLDTNSVDLVMTSPPFGLIKEKQYGNESSDEYLRWFARFAEGIMRVLKDSGSFVIDIGGTWIKGQPTRSLYHYELLIMLCRQFGFHLAQEFFWWNPAKLPLPAEWVNIRRIRVRDSVNCIWWLSKTPYPKVTNKRVLQEYSKSMKDLHKRGTYNRGRRSGGHKVGDVSFLKDNKGSIPHNLLAVANTKSNGSYYRYCRENVGAEVHPAQFPAEIPAFFVRMLTDKDDLVVDPFAGSCITGAVSESLDRRWTCCELKETYVEGAKGHFYALSDGTFLVQNRNRPYQASPPKLDLLSDDESPLVKDGGRKRPRP